MMSLEIEQKFIIHGEEGFNNILRQADGPISSRYIKQAYMVDNEAQGSLWRVRINTPLNEDGSRDQAQQEYACWTFKQRTPDPMTRIEIEEGMSINIAEELYKKSTRVVEKIRYVVPYKGQSFELDQFLGEHEGLFLLEIEKSNREIQVNLPVGVKKEDEVTGAKAFSNDELAKKTEFLRKIGVERANLIKKTVF